MTTLLAVPPPHARASVPAEGWYCRTETEDVDVHGGLAANWRLRYDQISAGRFRGSFEEVRLPGVHVFRERTNQRLRQRGDLGRARFGLALPQWSAPPPVPVMLNGRSVAAAEVALICNDAEIDLCTPPDFDLLGVDMDRGQLLDVLGDLRCDLDDDGSRRFGVAPLAASTRRRLGDLLSLAHQTARLAPWMLQAAAARQQLADTLILELADALPAPQAWPSEPQALRRKRLVDRACDLMLARPDDPPSLLEVCREVGASRRKLTDCFQEALGVSPAQYLRVIRLNGVRRTLQHGAPGIAGVYDAAVRWGFWHFGEFSRAYRLQFGELPSETLRRARPGALGDPARIR